MKDLLLLFFFAALAALLYRDCRKAARASGDTDRDFWVHVEAPLTAEQMDELDDLAEMEDLLEDLEQGFRELELYSYWRWREGKKAA